MKDGGPAYPCKVISKFNCMDGSFIEQEMSVPGMTIRQFYKAMAMMGYNANTEITKSDTSEILKWSADDADAQIAEDEAHAKKEG